jgi:hypothetical protein
VPFHPFFLTPPPPLPFSPTSPNPKFYYNINLNIFEGNTTNGNMEFLSINKKLKETNFLFYKYKKSSLIGIIIRLDSIDIHENHRKGQGYYAYININIIRVKSHLF